MRFFVLALAILLLPLRGWLGDAMAMDMAQQQLAHAARAAQTTHAAHAAHAMHDTADAHEPSLDHAAHAAAPSSPDCQTSCTHCQLCHSVGLSAWPKVPLPGEAPRAAPLFEPVAFASAEPAQGFKPPIS